MSNYKSEEEFLKNYNSDEFDKLSMNLSEPVVKYIKKKWKVK